MLKWTHRQSGYPKQGDLHLSWEVNGSAMSDDYAGTDDISAVDLLREWTKRYFPDTKIATTFGSGAVPIYWSIRGGAQEQAPFTRKEMGFYGEDFLTHFTWPVDADTGERLNFNTLPVVDMVWNDVRWDKGGFIQEATGWKPSPLQPVAHVPTILAAAGLDHLLS